MRRRTTATLALCGLFGWLVVAAGPSQAQGSDQHWVASWAASPTDAATLADAVGLPVPGPLTEQTFRMIVTPHLAGGSLRIHLSNRFQSAARTFGEVTVGTAGDGSVQNPVSVTFNGKKEVTAAAGQDVISDPVAFPVKAFTPLAVSIYVPGLQAGPTKHWNANASSFYSPPLLGNLTKNTDNLGVPLQTKAWFFVDGVDVEASSQTQAVVAFGDSITDGLVAATAASLPASSDVADKNGRYPDDLQRRLINAQIPVSVVNAGISSNRLLTDGSGQFLGPKGLDRLKADALDQAGVTGVLLLEGINDLGIPPTTSTGDQLIAGYEQAITAIHNAGKKIWLGTLMPASNALFDGTLFAPKSETYRQQVNTWIRTKAKVDGVVDFDAAMRDPSNPAVLKPDYAGPDNLHPNLVGYQAMADAINLNMLHS
ncbi:MAG: putative lipolytic protein family [Nocardia sp.]|uniref:GDSL-type esterase/lipase family protein n=1 Tax=Nocardia sp. TaxID=1821 RepID=UPI00260175BE|nr:GDSL-type esterase/lipase family protein [Nocardia sp.]MCU1642916.1 putative lipolytic protein family [Nocardia sp.]